MAVRERGRARALPGSMCVSRVLGTTASSRAGFSSHNDTLVYAAGSGVVCAEIDNGRLVDQKFYNYAPKQLAADLQPGFFPWDRSPAAPVVLGQIRPEDDRLASPVSANGSASPPRAKHKTSTNQTSSVAVARTGLVAVGETGYIPRVLIFSSDSPNESGVVAVIKEHQFGVQHLGFNPAGTLLATLGTANDGCLYIWELKSPTSIKPVASNRCISQIADLVWLSNTHLVTVGLRHVRVWTVAQPDPGQSPGNVLAGRNVVLGDALTQHFTCAVALPASEEDADPDVVPPMLLGTAEGRLFIHETGASLKEVAKLDEAVTSLAYNHGSLVACGPSKVVRIGKDWDILEELEVASQAALPVASELVYLENSSLYGSSWHSAEQNKYNLSGNVLRGVYSRQGRDIVTWRGKTVSVCDADLNPLSTSEFPFSVTQACARDGQLAACGDEGDVLIGNQLFETHTAAITDLDFAEDLVVTSSRDRCVQIFQKCGPDDSWGLVQTLKHISAVLKAKIGPNDTIITYTLNKSLQIHTRGSNGYYTPTKMLAMKSVVQDICVDSTNFIVATADKQITTYDLNGQVCNQFNTCDIFGESVALSHLCLLDIEHNRYIAGIANDKSVALYTYPLGVLVGTRWAHSSPPNGLCWVANGDLNKLVSTGECVFVYDVKIREEASAPSSPRRALRAASPTRLAGSSRPSSPTRPSSPSRPVSPSRPAGPSRPVSPSRPASPCRPASPPLSMSPTRAPSQIPSRPTSSVWPRSPSPIGVRRVAKPAASASVSAVPAREVVPSSELPSLRLSPTPTTQASAKSIEEKEESVSYRLERALQDFIASGEIVKGGELKELLMRALNQVEPLALVEKFGNDLLNYVKTQATASSRCPENT